MGTLNSVGGITAVDLHGRLAEGLHDYEFDHYRHYPSQRPAGWENLLLTRFDSMVASDDWSLFWSEEGGGRCLLAARVSKWDQEHFGFPTAGLQIIFTEGEYGRAMKAAFDACLESLQSRDVYFVSARIHGDQLPVLHLLEENGFRYYENIVWPVVATNQMKDSFSDPRVREMTASDLEAVIQIAESHQYPRGHFHCDPGFKPGAVDPMYGKWVRSAWEKKQPVLVVDFEERPAGYFVLEICDPISEALGYRYAGMRSLGLDRRARGHGLGIALFRGALHWMKNAGAEFVDSGYATKNHVSAKLHVRTGFHSVYEEVTFHRWLKAPSAAAAAATQ